MPPPLPSSSPGAVPGLQAPDTLQADLRTTQDIVWSCLATIFACTWVAMHPNLPNPQDTKWNQWKKRVGIMVLALLAPEFILLWAMKQRMAAGIIAKEYNQIVRSMCQPPQRCTWQKDCLRHTRSAPGQQKWTITHGFFIQMGGLMLVDGNTDCPYRVLDFPLLRDLIQSGKVVPVEISEEEICDKSKGDFLTKLIVIIQTSWFVVQCLARWALKLPVTELEIMTFSFALLNVMTYSILWKKPQNTAIPVKVPQKVTQKVLGDEIWRPRSSPDFNMPNNFPLSFPFYRYQCCELLPRYLGCEPIDISPHFEEMDITDAPFSSGPDLEPEENSLKNEPRLPKFGEVIKEVLQGFCKVTRLLTLRGTIKGLGDVIWGARSNSPESIQLSTPRFSTNRQALTDSAVFHGEPSPFDGELGVGPGPLTSPSGPHGVPPFHAGEEILSVTHGAGLLIFVMITGALFGGLHLIPWEVEFPTHTESVVWRASALCITVSPILVSLYLALGCVRDQAIRASFFEAVIQWGATGVLVILRPLNVAIRIATLLYIASRLSLILLSFTTLRSLNSDFYKQIPWNSYIPHI